MSIAHGAPVASFAPGAHPPIPPGEGIEPSARADGEGITDTLARLADRLAVLATAAHIMERRAPRDVYARSIAHEACVLALDMRDTLARARAGAPMRSPRIVDAAPDASPVDDAAPPAALDALALDAQNAENAPDALAPVRSHKKTRTPAPTSSRRNGGAQ